MVVVYVVDRNCIQAGFCPGELAVSSARSGASSGILSGISGRDIFKSLEGLQNPNAETSRRTGSPDSLVNCSGVL